MLDKLLVEKVLDEEKRGLLDHKWLVRTYLEDNEIISDQFFDGDDAQGYDFFKNLPTDWSDDFMILLNSALSPFKYINENMDQINKDKSLSAVFTLCYDIRLINNVDHPDQQLYYLSRLFNKLINSSRTLFMCYDCGTVARGIFFILIKAYRGQFKIYDEEIKRIKDDYYMTRFPLGEALDIYRDNLLNIKQNCLYLCAIQCGEKFGHIYIVEKIYKKDNPKPIYRLYQSCHRSFMLIDYLELMDYASDINTGIDIEEYLRDLNSLLQSKRWRQHEIDLFVKWFHFYPMGRISENDKINFASTYLIY
jgi:hypothetical protein